MSAILTAVQKISFGNKEYVKASEVAKQFRYTQDYVGQLCRGKKVDARLVGRTWYVELDSVAAYRKNKHKAQKTTAAHISINKRPPRNLHPKLVAPVLRSKTLKATKRPATDLGDRVRVVYGSDTEVAIPVVSKGSQTSAPAQPSHVSAPTATKKPVKKIKIKKAGTNKTAFSTEKFPEISLSGKIKVKELVHEPLPPALDHAEVEDQVLNASGRSSVVSQSLDSQPVKDTGLAVTTNQTKAVAAAEKHSARQTASVPSRRSPGVLQTSLTASHRMVHSDKFLLLSLTLGFASAVAILSMASLSEITPASSGTWSLFFDISTLTNFLR